MMRTEARLASQRIAGFKTLGKGVEITHPAVEPKRDVWRRRGAGLSRYQRLPLQDLRILNAIVLN
jgi:hypothetical protein